jgi:hypothetical protein
MFYGAGAMNIITEGMRTIDIAPTLALLAGIPILEMVDGRPALILKGEADW